MTTALVTLVAAVVSAAVALIAAAWQRPKLQAETRSEYSSDAERLSSISLRLVEPLERRINELESEVAELKTQRTEDRVLIADLQRGVAALSGQLLSMGQQPVWPTPPVS